MGSNVPGTVDMSMRENWLDLNVLCFVHATPTAVRGSVRTRVLSAVV